MIELETFDHGVTLGVTEATDRVIVTTAIGEGYFQRWKRFSLESWKRYSARTGVGIAVITKLPTGSGVSRGLNGAWAKLLAPSLVSLSFPSVSRFCLLDTDILISDLAPDIFDAVPPGRFGVVSLERTPMPRGEVRKRVAFLRHHFYSSKYPLDSVLHATPRQVFEQHGLPGHDDYFCSGLVVLDHNHLPLLRRWLEEVDLQAASASFAWEQPFLNHWVQEHEPVWLPYSFQAIWVFEMAWKYPFLYHLGSELSQSDLTAMCLEANLLENHFLHFAGSWFESLAWECELESRIGLADLSSEYGDYLKEQVEGTPRGKILPGTPVT